MDEKAGLFRADLPGRGFISAGERNETTGKEAPVGKSGVAALRRKHLLDILERFVHNPRIP
jgi:hypothetical protein